MLAWAVVNAPLTLLSFVIGLHWGAIGVAAAYSILTCLKIVPQFWFALIHAPVRLRDVLASLKYPLIASIVAGGAMEVARVSSEQLFGDLFVLVSGAAAGLLALLILGLSVREIRQDVRDVAGILTLALQNNQRGPRREAPPAATATG